MPIRRFVRVTSDPTAKTVFSEDLAAIVGILLAFAGIGLDQATGAAFFDPAASIAIGLLLLLVGFVLGRDQKGLLLGEAALPEEREALRKAILSHPAVRDVIELLTMHIGPRSLLVAVRVDFEDDLTADRIEEMSAEIEADLRAAVPDVTQVFLDPTSARRETSEVASA
jgi:cation diffusion facilitator family transporter